MPVDPELVRRKIRLVLEDLERLRPLADKSVDAYLASDTDEIVAERLLERMIGRMIDINFHLLVETGRMPPTDYHESFARLPELGILDETRAAELARAAGLRNRLAHEYNGIDERMVHQAAGRAVSELPEYLRAIEQYID
jgi:uncharacterized protein YutE (UPF0331/DUF86 family)